MGPEHDKYNSHQKRQMHLKGQWKIEDMDPEGSIKRDLHMRHQELIDRINILQQGEIERQNQKIEMAQEEDVY